MIWYVFDSPWFGTPQDPRTEVDVMDVDGKKNTLFASEVTCGSLRARCHCQQQAIGTVTVRLPACSSCGTSSASRSLEGLSLFWNLHNSFYSQIFRCS